MRQASVSARPTGEVHVHGRQVRLPRPRTSFVGREAEIAAVVSLLRDSQSRLVSIIGRSGAGKTRLAIEVARRLDAELPGGAVLVDFSALDDDSLVASRIAAALDLRIRRGHGPREALQLRLALEPTLIVADDIDHRAPAAAALLEIIAGCPGTRVLATAQAPLRTEGERIVRLGSLDVPDPSRASPTDLLASPAVALFCDRAGAVDHTFELTSDNAASIAELCRRLDGLPLAIELAAARSRILSTKNQLDVLDRGTALDLRPSRSQGGSARHRELRAAIDWTFSLAAESERRLLRRMGVFEGGCALDALRDVCSDPGESEADILDALAALVDINLVEPELGERDGRYRLLPTIREFAREQLADSGELLAITERHVDWFVRVAAETRELDDEPQLAALVSVRDNLHGVLGRLVARHDLVRGLALAADLAPVWWQQGYFEDAERWLERLLEEAANDELMDEAHARALFWAVLFDAYQRFAPERRARVVDRLARGRAIANSVGSVPVRLFGLRTEATAIFVTHDLPGATIAVREGLALAAASGDEIWQTRFENLAAMAAQQAGDVATAAVLGSSALERARRRHDRVSIVWAALLLHGLPPGTPGLPEALPPYEGLLEIAREAGDLEGEAVLLARLAVTRATVADFGETARRAAEGLELARRTGSTGVTAFCILALVMAAVSRGEDRRAAELHGSIAPVLHEVRMGLAPSRAEAYQAIVDQARRRLGEGQFDAIVASVGLKDVDARLCDAIAYARSIVEPDVLRPASATLPPGDGEPGLIEPLTPRELDVLRHLATGGSNKEIGTALGLRPKTVMHHSVSIYGKLGVRGRAEATAWAFRHGLMSQPPPAPAAARFPT